MKITSAILAALCLLTLSCRNDTSVNQTSATTGTTDTTTRAASVAALRTPDPPSGNTLRVFFDGLIAQMMEGPDRRAVVLDAPGHPRQIVFPISFKTDLDKAFKVGIPDCSDGVYCRVRIDGMAFQVVDGNGRTGAAFEPADFATLTKLKTIPGVGTQLDLVNLNSDIWATPPPKESDVAGIFELAGGKGSAGRFTCLYRFKGETAYHPFPNNVFVDYQLSSGSQLQFKFEVGQSNWSKVIDLVGPLLITIDNNQGGIIGSMHFKHFGKLSKPPAAFPDIEKKDPSCIEFLSDSAGCSNSQWP